ncbi:hypothetical protein AMTR_s00002p00202450 [Amborella trichopoda]|uniref:Phytocyanin domain-containing protein n=1 Tax=Amborella trichopoda TaxID=13333 RepID=W1NU24_AMBTC|nr:hypothetical protein AMTR_s00002p00202450 [Amborella trichopoda]
MTFTDGNTLIMLNETGPRYFICSAYCHCQTGLKLEVNVSSPAMAPSTPPTSTPNDEYLVLTPAPSGRPKEYSVPPPSSGTTTHSHRLKNRRLGVGAVFSTVP